MRDKETGSPPRTGSKLDPYWLEIAELRGSGCTLAGLRDALASKKVDVSISRLCTYIHHREEALQAAQQAGAEKYPAVHECTLHRDADEDPLAMLLLSQIKAQAARTVFRRGLGKEKS